MTEFWAKQTGEPEYTLQPPPVIFFSNKKRTKENEEEEDRAPYIIHHNAGMDSGKVFTFVTHFTTSSLSSCSTCLASPSLSVTQAADEFSGFIFWAHEAACPHGCVGEQLASRANQWLKLYTEVRHALRSGPARVGTRARRHSYFIYKVFNISIVTAMQKKTLSRFILAYFSHYRRSYFCHVMMSNISRLVYSLPQRLQFLIR